MDFKILEVVDIDDIHFTVSFIMYLGVRWKEPRFVEKTTPHPIQPHKTLTLHFLDTVWVPDIYVYNLNSIKGLEIFTDFAGAAYQIVMN